LVAAQEERVEPRGVSDVARNRAADLVAAEVDVAEVREPPERREAARQLVVVEGENVELGELAELRGDGARQLIPLEVELGQLREGADLARDRSGQCVRLRAQ